MEYYGTLQQYYDSVNIALNAWKRGRAPKWKIRILYYERGHISVSIQTYMLRIQAAITN